MRLFLPRILVAIDSPDRTSSRIRPRFVTEVYCLILTSPLLMSNFLLRYAFFSSKISILFCTLRNVLAYQQTNRKEN